MLVMIFSTIGKLYPKVVMAVMSAGFAYVLSGNVGLGVGCE